MPAGVQCFNAAGVLSFEATDYLGRLLGRVEITGAAGPGSVSHAGLTTGAPFGIFFVQSAMTGVSNFKTVAINIAGNTLSWSFIDTGTTGGTAPDGFIIYGVK